VAKKRRITSQQLLAASNDLQTVLRGDVADSRLGSEQLLEIENHINKLRRQKQLEKNSPDQMRLFRN